MDATQLNTLVKASSQCKHLIFINCPIILNTDLNFAIDEKYNLEEIDFKS